MSDPSDAYKLSMEVEDAGAKVIITVKGDNLTMLIEADKATFPGYKALGTVVGYIGLAMRSQKEDSEVVDVRETVRHREALRGAVSRRRTFGRERK